VAEGRHKRDTDARRFGSNPFRKPSLKLHKMPRAALVAAPVAVVATAAAVTVGLVSTGGAAPELAAADIGAAAAPKAVPDTAAPTDDPADAVSRSVAHGRATLSRSAKRVEGTTRWTTTALNLWKGSGKHSTQDGEAKEGTKVVATGHELNGRVEVLVDGETRWVTAGYLADEKPDPQPAGLSDQPCPDMSIEDGLKPQTIKVYRSVCHAFPEVTEYGGWAPRTEHDTGNAIDVMVYGDSALGDKIAAWAQEHAAELDLYDIIWYDRIWTPVRASEGWRDYGDHGSATANHMDHVHLGTN
jgi:hypothetical protein